MAPLSLRIVQDGGAVTRKMKLDPNMSVAEATRLVHEKANLPPEAKAYGLFLRSLDSDLSGIWLEDDKKLCHYLLRDGDQLDYMSKIRNLKLRMLDDTVKTFQVDQSMLVSELMLSICAKIGITNHEEYGMCFEQADESEEGRERQVGPTGTLTMKKRSKLQERDLEFEQLSKKLKTDDNVEWVDPHKSLSEAGVAPSETLLLKRRLFYSDRNVDSRDPVQLNLLYNQARDNMLHGRHPVTEEKAAEFAGIQCQIQFGDYQEDKHKPGFIENLSEYLPEQYCSAWGIERKILKEYSTHAGLNELDAKHLYTKNARALPTYGVTFFLVKEKQKGKKKLVPRLLGINSESILRLDETTKEIIQTWPLTHVKTYHAGKGETFTLNFGDYSDKEYSVKTRDAFRIRDILEGYIDLIRKRMLANYNMSTTEYGYVGQENIYSGQASMVQHIANNPSKIVQQSVVGPSKILEHVPGQRISGMGTQVVTAQQLVIAEMKNKQEKGVLKADISTRQDMGVPFTRRLNRLNSNSVKIVDILKDPTQAHIQDAQKMANDMLENMPSIREGVANTIAKQTDEAERRKLQHQMNELERLMQDLARHTHPDTANPAEAEDTAKQIASLSTEMYFAIAPETKRRSSILKSTRLSFIADEAFDKNRRRASFIAATATTNHAIDSATELAQEEYKGPALSPQQLKELEKAAVDKLGKLNAAIAHYLLAHSDPKNIDYSAAVNSLNIIHELMPDLARDGQVLACVKDDKDRSALVSDIQELCAAAKHLCSLSGVEDPQKLQEAAGKYSDVSGRLVYVFGKRGGKARADKENQIIDLTEQVVDKTSQLLNSTQGLAQLTPADPAAKQLNDAGAATAQAAKDLMTQTTLNAPTIDEPHCKSALTAASEALSSSAQLLAASWKPLVEHPSRHVQGEKLHHQAMELARALDNLREAYSGPSDIQASVTETLSKGSDKPAMDSEAQRLRFVNSLANVGGKWRHFEEDLDKPLPTSVSAAEASEAQRRLSNRLGQLNAAVASLLAATTVRENPDYKTAEAALAVIDDLMPEIAKDAKLASANQDEASRAELLANIKELCAASKQVCACAYGAEPEALNEAIMNFTDSSSKLTFVCNRRYNPDRESQLIDATSAACGQVGALLSRVQQGSEAEQGARAEELDAKGAALADAARALFTVAQVTAPSISDPRCQSTLLSAVDKVAATTDTLQQAWRPLAQDEKHKTRVQDLNGARKDLDRLLEEVRKLCQVPDDDMQSSQQQFTVDGSQSPQKLQFIATMRGAQDKLAQAQKELNKPAMPAKGTNMEAVQHRLDSGLQELNAAIASLLAATADRENPDSATAQHATETITKLMPQLIRDTKTVSTSKEECARAAMLAEIKALCDASEAICASSYGADTKDRNDAVSKFAEASGKLVFVANPRRKPQKTNEVSELAKSACKEASALLPHVQALAAGVGGAPGKELVTQGGRLDAAARNLHHSVQILGPSPQSPQSQELLLSSASSLSQAGKQLEGSVLPYRDDNKHGAEARDALHGLKTMENALDGVKTACKTPDMQSSQQQFTVDGPQSPQKLQFIATMRGAQDKLAQAQKELNKPAMPAKGTNMEAAQHRLDSGLQELNAAIASLLAATADRENPDSATAQQATETITKLMPQLIRDTKTVSAGKEECARAAMLAEIKALCDASEAICASSYGADTKDRNDAVSKFAEASGKLVFVANPRRKPQKTNEVSELAKSACKEASALLPHVQALAAGVGGAPGKELVTQGGRLDAAARNLHHSVQILGPSPQSPQSQEVLLSSASSLSQAGKQLEGSVLPYRGDNKHGAEARDALHGLKTMEDALDGVRTACKTPDMQSSQQQFTVAGPQSPQKLQFIATMRGAQDKLAQAQKELNKPAMPAKGTNMEAVQHRLDSGLQELNAAIASLLAATADRENPDSATAQQATETITKLMPQLIRDTKTVSASKEECARAAMLAEIKALCDASEAICASSYGADTKDRNDAVTKFADASGKLVFVANPRRKPQKTNEVSELAKSACKEASALLPHVQALAAGVGGAPGKELVTQGGRLDAAARNLHHSVQILGPSPQSPQRQEVLLSSASSLSQAGKQLEGSVLPYRDDNKHGAEARDALHGLKTMENALDGVRTACKTPGTQNSREQQKLQFITALEANKGKWADVQKELKKPVPPSRGSDTKATEERLSSRLAALDAAIAALLASTADKDKPSYKEAEASLKTIQEILPQIVQDTKTVSAGKEECTRAAMLAEIKALCVASEAICASSYGTDTKDMNDAVAKYSEATGKLVFVANPRASRPKLQKEVLSQAQTSCGEAAALLSGVQQLAEAVGGSRGRELDDEGGKLADAAQNLLHTAQVTSSSLSSPASRSALQASAQRASEAASALSLSLASLGGKDARGVQAQHLSAALHQLLAQLGQMRSLCDAAAAQETLQEEQKLQFVKTLEASRGKWADVQKELKKSVPPSRGPDTSAAEQRLGSRLAALDAAVATLLASTADKEKPSYVAAEESVKTIQELLPQIVQDTKTVSASKEECARAAMLDEIKALCDASEAICASSYGADTKGVNEAVSKYSDASSKLMYVANPKVNRQKEKDILEQAQSACGSTAALLSGVQQLAEAVGGSGGRELDDEGGKLADAAQNLLHTAQITSTSLSSPDSRSALLSSIAGMQSATASLQHTLDTARGQPAQQLSTELSALRELLEDMKSTCNAPDTTPPAGKKPPPLPSSKPPVVHAVYKGKDTKPTQEFLDRLRLEEGMAQATPLSPGPTQMSKQQKVKPAPPVRTTDDEKMTCPVFIQSLENAGKSIKTHESDIMKQCRLPSGGRAALSHRDMQQKQARLQRHLALAGLEVAHLVDANYADKVDYSAGLKSTKALPELMTSIVEDGTQLADNLNDMARKAFLYDMLQLCEAGRKICEAGLSDRQKLNDAAVNFGDTSTKLLYVVSSDVDPALEKEIISRAKAIGDSASHLALDAANVAAAASGTGGGDVQLICDAGTACVDAAGKLVYTAKLTAPSIHEAACQDALVASTQSVSTKLKTFADSWAPLESDSKQAKTISHLSTEAANLEKLLSALRSDVKEGAIGRRRELEQLVIEDTPMRLLTIKILEEAKHHAESSSLAAPEKIAYAAYVDKVTAALREVDLANARCKKSPHDTEKRRELEGAIQNLQMILLQSRPSRGEKGKTNIVDLMDFMEEVASEAKSLSSVASTAKVPAPQDMLALEEIKDKCDTIHSKASKLISGEVDSDLDFNDLFDQFGLECENTIKKLNEDVKRMEDNKTKKLLESKVMALSESCNMLRFATKSGISTEACCTLDATLDELDDIEERVIKSIVDETKPSGVTLRTKKPPQSTHSPATINLCREVTSSPEGVAAATVTAYIADAAAKSDGTPEDNNKLLRHLYKLVHLLKTLTVTSSARAATWQPCEGPDTARLTEQILQEINNPESKFGVKPEESKQKILEEDIAKLLIPSAPKILGDKRQQEDKLNHIASQLSSTCSNLSHSVSRDSPADATRNLSHLSRVAADQARELDGIARGVNITDPVQRRRIDEAAKEMCFATYNVLKTAESACLEPKNSNMKRRLADALQNLNNSIDKLVWHSSSSPVLSRACGALSRGAAAQLAALAPKPSSAAPFHDTCDLMMKQNEQISKLRSEQAMPRKEFMRNLDDIGTAVRTSVECAAQCAYYIAVSDTNKDIAKSGLVDVPKLQKSIESIQDSCMAIIGSSQIDQAKEQKEDLHKRISDFSTSLEQAQMLVKDGESKRTLQRARSVVSDAAGDLESGLDRQGDMEHITPKAVSLLEAVNTAHSLIEQCPLVPAVGDMSADTRAQCDEVMNQSKSLLNNTLALIKDVQSSAGAGAGAGAAADDDDEMMTWVTFNTNRKKLLDAYDALLKTVRRNGHRAGVYEKAPEEEVKEPTKKSYMQIQVDLANKWLKSPACKAEVKSIGQQAARNVVDMARQMSEDLRGSEREEVRGVITETEELLAECTKKYDHEKNSLLMDRLKELRKSIQRGVVTRVVEDFIEAETPLADLDLLADTEQDESKRKFILERKIASLLAQLGRVSKTARFVANSSPHQGINLELTQSSEQTELLAPMLVKAAQQRIDHPDDKAVIEKYKALLAEYAESISKVRDLCDRALDPMEFVQTAGETMQRMREDMTQQSTDTQKCAYTSAAISKLANRVINVSMSSNAVASDPELQKALVEAKKRLHAVTPAPDTRASRLPDWRDTTAEILRTTGDVESALGGENIFKKEPTTANQPIYSVARSLHESVKEWSSRDNEIVGVARRMAVLMARLSEYMETDKKDALIETSKSIVAESQEVTELAKKLAHECTDVRIKTNLLQTCERIPTISGQLKMLTAVKAASLGQQAVEEDKEAMDMLVGNAESLMMSISDVVKAAASASVKIMSQRGPRLRWVRKTYY